MDSFELNKMAGAFLGVVFVVMSISIVSDAIFDSPAPEKAGYAIEVEGGDSHGGGGETKADTGPEPIAPLLASADVEAGKKVFKKCAACHTSDEGGANKVGPNLWDIVNRPIASADGFNYSSSLNEFSSGNSVVWDYAHLNGFLLKPKTYVKGTSMGFAGIKKVEDRANIVAYLRTFASSPAALPEAAPAADESSSEEAAGESTEEPAATQD